MRWQGIVLIVAVVGAILVSKLTGLATPVKDSENGGWFDGGHDGCDADGGHGCD